MALTIVSSNFGIFTPLLQTAPSWFGNLDLLGEPYNLSSTQMWNCYNSEQSSFQPQWWLRDILNGMAINEEKIMACFPFKEDTNKALVVKLQKDSNDNASFSIGIYNKQGNLINSIYYSFGFTYSRSTNYWCTFGTVNTNKGLMFIPAILGRSDSLIPPASANSFYIDNLDYIRNKPNLYNALLLSNYNTFDNMYGEEANEGGYSSGSFDNSSDTISIPNKPTYGVSGVGFINLYKCNIASLQEMGKDLFPEFIPIEGGSIVDAMAGVCENVAQAVKIMLNSNLINYIIDCHILPVTPTVGTIEHIQIGYKTMPQSAYRVTNDYVDFDCGTLNIKEYYNNFIDYMGTEAKLFLPFVGFVPLEPEWFQSGFLNVSYRFNIVDGSFVAFIKATSSKSKLSDSVVAQYGGNACVHIPITGVNYSNMVSGVANAISNPPTSLSSIVNSAEVGTRPSVQSSNGYNSTTAFLGIRKPYILIERQVSQYPSNYAKEMGIPSNINKKLGDLSGFTTASTLHLDNINATDSEKKEIANLLASGVIL